MPTSESADQPIILLTGGSGYVGGRLIPLLEQQGVRLRCLARNPDKLRSRVQAATEIVQGDVLDPPSLDQALQGVHTAYYLVHLMSGSKDFEKEDRQAATNFAEAAKKAGVRRIIYLGGLGDDADPKLSPHLRSRHEVGKILRDSGVETIEFRASLVIGTGSLSFDLVKSLTDRLPVMLCPRWLTTPTQPIAVDDVLAYLLAAKDLPPGESRIFEIGSPDVTTYGDMIREYARQKGLRRWLISVPVLTPYLSSLWLALVTPASFEVGRHLIEGLKNPTVVRDRIGPGRVPDPPDGDSGGDPEGDRRNGRLSTSLRPLRAPGLHFTATPRYIEPTILGVPSSKNRSTWTSRNGPDRTKASISTSRRQPPANSPLERGQAALPALNSGLFAQPVLQEDVPPSWSEHPTDLG